MKIKENHRLDIFLFFICFIIAISNIVISFFALVVIGFFTIRQHFYLHRNVEHYKDVSYSRYGEIFGRKKHLDANEILMFVSEKIMNYLVICMVIRMFLQFVVLGPV